MANFISDTYRSKFQYLFDNSDVIISESSLKFLSSINEPTAPEILSIDLPESFELHLTNWSFLPIQLTIFDANGANDIRLVKFEVLREFEGCLDDNNGDGDIDYVEADIDGDGYADGFAVDSNNDGSFDYVEVDLDGDGFTDGYASDTDLDGKMDTFGVDLDGDGLVDVTGHDYDQDGVIDDYDDGGDDGDFDFDIV